MTGSQTGRMTTITRDMIIDDRHHYRMTEVFRSNRGTIVVSPESDSDSHTVSKGGI